MLPTAIVTYVRPSDDPPASVAREFRRLVEDELRLCCVGEAADHPQRLLSLGYTPRHRIELFGTTFWLTNLRFDVNFRLFVAYVRLPHSRDVFARLFYKDSSLVWRCATHYIWNEEEQWIGKGELKPAIVDGEELLASAEETTNLPLELQGPLDEVSRRGPQVRRDERAAPLVLRNAPNHRMEPYDDFSGPRRRARANPENLIHGGREVAWFERAGDPTSLRFAPGFEPDFHEGAIEITHLRSRMYGGDVHKHRILSSNGQIQYQFIATPKLVWIVPPQTLTTELNSFGVRTIDVEADEDVFVPGYEYHFVDETVDPPQLHSQIPRGFAGAQSEIDPERFDAAPWLEKLPVIQAFRREVLARR